MDNLVLIQVARDLSGLEGAVLKQVREEDQHRYRLLFTHDDGLRSLLISVRPEMPWIGRPAGRWEGPKRSSRFAANLQKALSGSKIEQIRKPGPGRSIRIDFSHRFSLVVELAPHASNLILLAPDGTVELPLRTPPSARARLEKGHRFEAASLPDRLLVAESASCDEIQHVLDERCAKGDDPATAMRRGLFGIGGEAACVIVREAAGLGISPAKRCRQRLEQVLAGKTLFLPWSPEESPAADSAARLAGLHYEQIERQSRFDTRIEGLRIVLKREIRKNETLSRRVREDLGRFESPERFRHWGEAILAGLTQARRIGGQIHVPDPYDQDGALMEIPDRGGKTLPAVAEHHFGQYRRALRGVQAAERRRAQVERKLETMDVFLDRLETITTLENMIDFESDLRRAGLSVGLTSPGKKGRAVLLSTRPRLEGIRVYARAGDQDLLVGKDGKSNARLTFKLAGPEDFWLHARGHTGAHVVIRNPERKARPSEKALIEAASAAAWFSTAREHGLADVQWTRRKYVRKVRKGAPGAVIVKKSETIRVRPAEPRGSSGPEMR
jgi:predicted ribosome quality control (RQC) complex YloA/Tae2 family protein